MSNNLRNLLLSTGFVALLAGVGAAIHALKTHEDSQGWEIVRIEKDDFKGEPPFQRDRVVFKNGKILDSIGYDLKYIGELETGKTLPALIFSGKDCVGCGTGLDFFVYSLADSHMTYFPYPAGKASTEGEDKPFYEGRAFYGNCLPKHLGLVAFGSSRQEDDSWKKLVMLFSLDQNGELEETTISGNLPDIETSLKAVSNGQCHEFPQENYSEE